MNNSNSSQSELDYLTEISQRNFPGKLMGYGKLSGPGWIQATVALGGGSLGEALPKNRTLINSLLGLFVVRIIDFWRRNRA